MHVNSLMPIQISIGRLMWSSGSIRHEIASCSLVSNELFEHMLFPLTVIKEIYIYIYIYIFQCGKSNARAYLKMLKIRNVYIMTQEITKSDKTIFDHNVRKVKYSSAQTIQL